jgi:hypothetical protein
MDGLSGRDVESLLVGMRDVREQASRALTALSTSPRPRLFTRAWAIRVALGDALRTLDHILELLTTTD